MSNVLITAALALNSTIAAYDELIFEDETLTSVPKMCAQVEKLLVSRQKTNIGNHVTKVAPLFRGTEAKASLSRVTKAAKERVIRLQKRLSQGAITSHQMRERAAKKGHEERVKLLQQRCQQAIARSRFVMAQDLTESIETIKTTLAIGNYFYIYIIFINYLIKLSLFRFKRDRKGG